MHRVCQWSLSSSLYPEEKIFLINDSVNGFFCSSRNIFKLEGRSYLIPFLKVQMIFLRGEIIHFLVQPEERRVRKNCDCLGGQCNNPHRGQFYNLQYKAYLAAIWSLRCAFMSAIYSVTSGLVFLGGQFPTNPLPGLCLVWTVTSPVIAVRTPNSCDNEP